MDEDTKKEYEKLNPVVMILMKDDEDWVDFNDLKKWEGETDARLLTEGIVEKDLTAFESFMRERTGDPLAKPEKAILKTYLAWKLGLHQEQAENA